MSENKEARELAAYKAKTDLSAMLKSEEATPYELIKKKLEDLHFDLIQQSAESAVALSEMQASYQDQINSLKKQLLRRESIHKQEIESEQKKFNQMVLDYTNIIEDLNKNGRTEIQA